MYNSNVEAIKEALVAEGDSQNILYKMNELLRDIHLDMNEEVNMHKLASLYYAAGDVLIASSGLIEGMKSEAK